MPQDSEKSVSTFTASKEFVKSLYEDPVRWQLTKSLSFFLLGIYLARDISSVPLFEGSSI